MRTGLVSRPPSGGKLVLSNVVITNMCSRLFIWDSLKGLMAYSAGTFEIFSGW